MKKIVLFTALLVVFAACSKKQNYSVTGTLDDKAYNGKDIVFRKSENGQIVVEDTIKITKSAFQFKGALSEGTEIRTVLMPETELQSFTLVLEPGNVTVNITKDSIIIGGTPLNDKLQVRNRQNQLIVDQIAELDKSYDEKVASGSLTPDGEAAYKKERYDLLIKNTDDIIAFIKENIQNPLGKFFFMKYYIGFPPERREEMMAFAPDDLKAMYAK